MDSFRLISVILSMVLGLGVTRLLTGFVAVFRARSVSPIDWVPLGWGASLFLVQLQYWWAINDLPATGAALGFPDFIALVVLTLSLYLAPALLLPSRAEDEVAGMRSYFQKDGRYGVLFIAVFFVLGFIANIYFFEAPLGVWALLDVPMVALPVIAFFASIRSRGITAAATLAFMPLLAIDIWVSLAGA